MPKNKFQKCVDFCAAFLYKETHRSETKAISTTANHENDKHDGNVLFRRMVAQKPPSPVPRVVILS